MSTYLNPVLSRLCTKGRRAFFDILILTVILIPALGVQAASAQYETSPNIDSEAAAVLQSMSNYLGSRSDYSFKADEYAFDPVLSEFLFINTFKTLTKNVTSGRSLGPSRVSGAMCRHLIFRGNDIDWQIWIEDGNRPVPRKLVITYKSRPESPQFIALIKDWVSNKTIRDAAYKPDIPNKISKQGEFLQITGRPEFAGISIRAFQ